MNSEVNKTHFEMAWKRVKEVTGWTAYKELAEFVDSSTASVAGVKKRGKFNLEWAHKIAQHFGSYTDYIMDGNGPMRRDKNAVLYERAEGLKDKDLSAEQLAGEAITIARSAMDTGDMNVNLIVTIVKNMTADRTPNEKLEINAAIMLALAEARKRQDAQRNQS